MKHPKRKLIGGILLLLVLTGAFGGIFLLSNAGGMVNHQMDINASMIKAVSQSLESDLRLSRNIGTAIQRKAEDRVLLGAKACRKVLEDDWDGKPMFFLDGAVITVSENGIRYPKSFPAEAAIELDQLTGERGQTYTYFSDDDSSSNPSYAVCFCRVNESAWYPPGILNERTTKASIRG